jgi:hypothetical protein
MAVGSFGAWARQQAVSRLFFCVLNVPILVSATNSVNGKTGENVAFLPFLESVLLAEAQSGLHLSPRDL